MYNCPCYKTCQTGNPVMPEVTYVLSNSQAADCNLNQGADANSPDTCCDSGSKSTPTTKDFKNDEKKGVNQTDNQNLDRIIRKALTEERMCSKLVRRKEKIKNNPDFNPNQDTPMYEGGSWYFWNTTSITVPCGGNSSSSSVHTSRGEVNETESNLDRIINRVINEQTTIR